MSYQILVVGNLSESRSVLTDLLQKCDCAVSVADGPADALLQARNLKPRVVFVSLDRMSPDAWEVAQQFRGEPALAGSKLVAVAPPDYDIAAIHAAGFHHVLPQPLDLRALHLVLYADMPTAV